MNTLPVLAIIVPLLIIFSFAWFGKRGKFGRDFQEALDELTPSLTDVAMWFTTLIVIACCTSIIWGVAWGVAAASLLLGINE